MERFILITLIREQLEFRTNSRGKPRWYEWVGNARDVKYSSIRPRIAGKHFWKIVYWEAGFLHILLRSIHFLVTISLSTGANELFLVQFMLFNPFPGNDEPVSGSEESKSTSNGLPVLTAPDFGGSGFVPMARLWVHLLSSGVSGGEKVLDKLYFNTSLLDAFSPLL